MLEVGKRVVPILQEFGIEGFVIAGYARFDGEHLERFVGGMNTQHDPAIADGLAKLIAFSSVWAAPDFRFDQPPHEKQPGT